MPACSVCPTSASLIRPPFLCTTHLLVDVNLPCIPCQCKALSQRKALWGDTAWQDSGHLTCSSCSINPSSSRVPPRTGGLEEVDLSEPRPDPLPLPLPPPGPGLRLLCGRPPGDVGAAEEGSARGAGEARRVQWRQRRHMYN